MQSGECEAVRLRGPSCTMNATVQRYYNQARSWEHRQEDTPTLTKTYKVITEVLRAGKILIILPNYCRSSRGEAGTRALRGSC